MRTIRRLYFYAVVFVTVEVVVWGLIRLLRTIFSSTNIIVGSETLSQALALILVGLPLFLFHWLWAQRISAAEEEEHSAGVRAIFLYAILLATLIPLVQNILALTNRSSITSAGMAASRAFIGGQQVWSDNLIAILINGLVAAYFYTVLRRDWETISERESFIEVRRLYRYIWLLYSLLMTVFGAQQVLRFLFFVPTEFLGEASREIFVNGLTLLVVGTPIWIFSWRICQQALSDPGERASNLRLGVLYLLALSGVMVVLTSAGITFAVLLRRILGESISFENIMQNIGGPLSIGIPLAAVWAYYGGWLQRDIASVSDEHHRAGLKRLYLYILSLIGLIATFIGLVMLVSMVIDLIARDVIWGDSARSGLTASLATLAVGLPLWLASWRPMQAEALAANEAGAHARRSLVRKVYLYFVLFGSVIGGMVSAVIFIYQILQAIFGEVPSDFVANLLDVFQVLVLFVLVLLYHLYCLRLDGSQATRALVSQHEQFPVMVLEAKSSGFATAIVNALKKQMPSLMIKVQSVEKAISKKDSQAVKAVILPADLAVEPPSTLAKWLKDFDGHRVVVPTEKEKWLWAGLSKQKATSQAAQIIRQLAEGQEVRLSAGTPAWMIVVYVFAALFGLQMLLVLVTSLISAFVD